MKVEVNLNEFKKEAAKRKVKKVVDDAKKTAKNVGRWCVNHPGEAITIGLAAGTTINRGLKWHQTAMENYRRKVDYYDPRTGHHAIAKHPLSPKQQAQIERRYRNGETYTEVLYDMRLLKR